MNEKYLLDGRCVNLIQKLDNGRYLVENIYKNEDDFYDYVDIDNSYVVEKIFDKVPVAKYQKEISVLTESIEELKITHRKMTIKIVNAEKEYVERMKKFEKYKSLKRLEDFIDGKITHYAILSAFRPKVLKFGDAKCEYSKEELKLLSLFGDTKGDLEWRLNTYSDGSGGTETVIPCQSEDEAKKIIADYLYKYCTEVKNNKDWLPSMENINKAQSFGAVIPKELIEKVKANHLMILKKNEEEAKKKYEEEREKRVNFKI